MTDEERQKFYLDNNGMLCPFCKSKYIHNIDDIEIGIDGHSWIRIRCYDCKKEWTDDYELTGFTETEEEEQDE